MLLNVEILRNYVGCSEAPVVVQCPRCGETFHRSDWWKPLQTVGLDILCVCGFHFDVPRFGDLAEGVSPELSDCAQKAKRNPPVEREVFIKPSRDGMARLVLLAVSSKLLVASVCLWVPVGSIDLWALADALL